MSVKSGGLGRGLEALMEDVSVTIVPETAGVQSVDKNSISMIDINSLKPNTSQPRKVFNEEKLEELASSINEHGVIQPILVRPGQSGFEIVAGERRWRAARKAGLTTVPCVIKELDERENILIALIENMQRENLSAIEEAEAYDEMINTHGLTQSDIARSMGKSRPYVTNSLRLLKLPEEVKEYISSGILTGAHARTLAGLNDEKKQVSLARKIAEGKLSVRAVEELVAGEKKSDADKAAAKKPAKEKTKKDKYIAAAEDELKERLGTKVSIKNTGKRGKIEIEYYSQDELNSIIEIIKGVE